MAPTPIDIEQEVADALVRVGTTVLGEVDKELNASAKPMPVHPDAKLWWINHYTRTFFFAKVVLGRNWATDEANVLDRARELARKAHAAAVLAGHTQVEVADAKLASMHVDCGMWRSANGTLGPLYRWC